MRYRIFRRNHLRVQGMRNGAGPHSAKGYWVFLSGCKSDLLKPSIAAYWIGHGYRSEKTMYKGSILTDVHHLWPRKHWRRNPTKVRWTPFKRIIKKIWKSIALLKGKKEKKEMAILARNYRFLPVSIRAVHFWAWWIQSTNLVISNCICCALVGAYYLGTSKIKILVNKSNTRTLKIETLAKRFTIYQV